MPHLGRLIALFHFNLLINIMKKFFGMLLAAVSALVLLPCCGGGGDGEPTKMSAEDFARGAKYFMLGNGINGTLYVCPSYQYSGYQIEDGVRYVLDDDGNYVEDDKGNPTYEVIGNSKTASAISGTLNVGSKGGVGATFDYFCEYNDDGVPVRALLRFSTLSSGVDSVIDDWLSGAQAEDEVNNLQGAVAISIDFVTNSWSMTVLEEDADGNQAENTHGGSVIVQHQ